MQLVPMLFIDEKPKDSKESHTHNSKQRLSPGGREQNANVSSKKSKGAFKMYL